MNITVNDVMYVVLTVIIPFLTAVLARYIQAKTNGTLYADAMAAIIGAVDTVQQTYVGALKEAGKFDAEAQEEARKRAVDTAIKNMSEASVKYLNKLCGSAEEFVLSKIEACVIENKHGEAK